MIAMLQSSGSAQTLLQFVPIAAIVGIFYFLVILPGNKQRKKVQVMLDALKKGDRVITQGGIYGTVQAVESDVIQLKIAENVKIRILRSAVTGVVGDTQAD